MPANRNEVIYDSYLRDARGVPIVPAETSCKKMDKVFWYNVLRASLAISLIPVVFGLIQVFLFENDDRFLLYNTWWQWLIFNALITFLLTVSASTIGMYVHIRLPYEKTRFAVRLPVLLAATAVPAGLIMYLYHMAWCPYLRLDCFSREHLFTNITLAVVITILITVFSEGARLFEMWKASLVKESLLREENLKSQLEVLKSQINPHFLFNTLNSIYIQSDKDADTARESILHFADLLSYQLYDSREKTVDLKSEAEHLNHYIELEKMRQGDAVAVETDFPVLSNGIRIAPLLFTPLIENAFKYGLASGLDQYRLHISLAAGARYVRFRCENEFRPTAKKGKGGLGLENLRKRLELIYPGRHTLTLNAENGTFTAELEIEHQP